LAEGKPDAAIDQDENRSLGIQETHVSRKVHRIVAAIEVEQVEAGGAHAQSDAEVDAGRGDWKPLDRGRRQAHGEHERADEYEPATAIDDLCS